MRAKIDGSNAILLAGLPRCGSTWLANILGRSASTRTVFEPDGPISDVLGAMVATRLGAYPVLDPDEKSGWYRLVWDLAFSGGWPWDRVEGARATGRKMVRIHPAVRDAMIAGLAVGTSRLRTGPQHIVVKSVNCAFTLDWIDRNYSPKIVVLHRNPLNVVSSWMVLDMNKWPVGEDPRVRSAYLEPLGITPPPPSASEVRKVAYNVGLLTLALKTAAQAHPDWITASYDELSSDPVAGCTDLFGKLGLEWTEEAEHFLDQADDPSFVVHGGNPKAHPNAVTSTESAPRRAQQASQFKRRLTEDEIEQAWTELDRFDLGSWGLPAR